MRLSRATRLAMTIPVGLLCILAGFGGPSRLAFARASPATQLTRQAGASAGWTSPHLVATGESLSDISCSSDRFYAAIGRNASDTASSAAIWSNGTWAGPVLLASGSPIDQYDAIDCPADAQCIAITSTGYARWLNAGRWSSPQDFAPDASAAPPGSSVTRGVSCGTPSFCVVGVSTGTTGAVVTWSRGSWSAPAAVPAYADSIICRSRSFCAIGGDGVPTSEVAFFNGSRWTPEPPSPITGSFALSCVTRSFCMATGGFHAAGDIAATFNGIRWSSVTRPPGEGPAEGFASVACPSASFCVAIDSGAGVNGALSSPSDRTSAIFTWDGKSWSTPIRVDAVDLASLSCPTTRFCMAVDIEGRALEYSG